MQRMAVRWMQSKKCNYDIVQKRDFLNSTKKSFFSMFPDSYSDINFSKNFDYKHSHSDVTTLNSPFMAR